MGNPEKILRCIKGRNVGQLLSGEILVLKLISRSKLVSRQVALAASTHWFSMTDASVFNNLKF
jgi:hypothetical protein